MATTLADLIGTPDIQVSLDETSIKNLALYMVGVIVVALTLWVIARKFVK